MPRLFDLGILSGLSMLLVTYAMAQNEVLPDDLRTNGSATLKPVQPFHAAMAASTVQVSKTDGGALMGVIVSEDGYILSKASESAAPENLQVKLPDGSMVAARKVSRDDHMDLLLIKVERTGLSPVLWDATAKVAMGQWLTALTGDHKELRLGVMSATRRAIPNSGAVLGIRMGVDDSEDGVLIEEVATESPAEKAGLQAEDLVMTVAGKPVARNAAVAKILDGYHPGDSVKIRYSRKGKEAEAVVRLASKSHVLMNWSGGDFANHGTSVRTDNYPDVIQHDLALGPDDMGGAVYNLEGKAIGFNIARVDRVTNFALPAAAFLSSVQKWIKDDRIKIDVPR